MTDRSTAEALDAADPLARWRDEFVIADPDLVYLDGNSLGRTPKRTVEALRHVVAEQWAGDLIASWHGHDWLDLALTVGDELAPLLGASPGEVAVHESTTVSIFQQVNVALDLVPGRRVIAVDDGDFPTDRYVVEGIARLRGVEVRHGLDDLDGVDVVVRSLVDYRTAEVADLAGETARATAAGATTVWDLSHAAGVLDARPAGRRRRTRRRVHVQVPQRRAGRSGVRVRRRDRCRIGWCSRSGAGSPRTTSSRWSVRSTPDPGIGRMLNGTPPVLGLTAAAPASR